MSHVETDTSKKITIKLSLLLKYFSRLENKKIQYAKLGQQGGTMGELDYLLTIVYEDK